MKIIRTDSYEQMSRQAANILSAQVILHPTSVLGLATGSTPVGIYKQLVEWYHKGDLDFKKIKTVNLDEYIGLSGESDQSYRYYMDHALFQFINIDLKNTFVPNGMAEDAEAECQHYDAIIEQLGGIDLQLLGIGHNGHIGFNEPNFAFHKTTHVVDLGESTIDANARFFDSKDGVPKRAITMGMKSIMQSRKIVLTANGKDKSDILEKALYGPVTPAVPASILQLHPDLTVVCNV